VKLIGRAGCAGLFGLAVWAGSLHSIHGQNAPPPGGMLPPPGGVAPPPGAGAPPPGGMLPPPGPGGVGGGGGGGGFVVGGGVGGAVGGGYGFSVGGGYAAGGGLSTPFPPGYQPQPADYYMGKFYYYPYYNYPHNYWPLQTCKWPERPGEPYRPPPAYMSYPPFMEPHWRYEFYEPQRYYRGFHFWLDQF
jgi:hypothetical protein